MSEILHMVGRVTIFVLAASLFTNLFAGTEYKKYLQYVIGLLIILLVISPVISFFKGGNHVEDILKNMVFTEKEEEFETTLKRTGQTREQELYEQYGTEDDNRFIGK